MGSIDKRFVCDKKVNLWSKFEFNRIPNDTSAEPSELQTPGGLVNYVTRFIYIARQAGYGGDMVVTKIPENEELLLIIRSQDLTKTTTSWVLT